MQPLTLPKLFGPFLVIFLLSTHFVVSQEMLRLEDAIESAVANNLGIAVSQMDLEIAERSIYRSNAGFGPVIDLNATANGTVNRVNQNFIDGREVKRAGRSIAPNANISLDWTIYDGGRMQSIFDRLIVIGDAVNIETQLQIQEIVVAVMQAYYEIERQKERGNFLGTIIQYYEDRLRITEERWQVGRGSKLDYLQSQTDLNAQLSEQSNAQNQLRNAKVVLNGLLNRNLEHLFDVESRATTHAEYDLDSLIGLVDNLNRDLILLQKMKNINELTEKEIEANRKPQVLLRSSLGYNYLNTNAGFLLTNRTASLTAGLTARWNIYDGKHQQNQLAIAKLQTQRIERQYEELRQQIHTDLTLAYNQFRSDQELLEFEKVNQTLAEENLSISVEKFKLGDSSILEVNEAQRTFDTAINRLVNAQYNVKISELELLRLSGSLISR